MVRKTIKKHKTKMDFFDLNNSNEYTLIGEFKLSKIYSKKTKKHTIVLEGKKGINHVYIGGHGSDGEDLWAGQVKKEPPINRSIS